MSFEPRRSSTSHRHWKLNWWDLWPLVDCEERPVQWTPNSLIFSPHPSSPIVLVRSFPSSSSFSLPSPNPLLSNPNGYSPPSVIEVSPSDEYVFAFFDGKGNEAVACIWHREETIDTWKVNIFWHVKPGQGIVLAKWLGEERMWLRTAPPRRAPPLGPSNLFGKITLLLVNQSHAVQIVHRPSPSFPFQLTSASLRHASQVNAGDRAIVGESTNGPGGLNVCVKAAIGMGYDESSIIIATSSTLIPPASVSLPKFSLGATESPVPSLSSPSQSLWEQFGPEQVVRLCEVKVTAHGFPLGLSTMPIPLISPPVPASSRVTNMIMIPHLPSTEASSLEIPVMQGATSPEVAAGPMLHIIMSFIDFENCSSPRSELLCFELQKRKGVPVGSNQTIAWCHRHISTRTFTISALSFIVPSQIPGASHLLVGLLDLEGVTPKVSQVPNKAKTTQVGIGKVSMLKFMNARPALEDDVNWESSILMTAADEADTDPPISAKVSPAGSLLCTSPAVWSGSSKLIIQAHPRYLKSDTPSVSQLTESLLSTLLLDRPPTDVLHSLCSSTLPLSSAIDVLEQTLGVLDCEEFSTRDWHNVILGIALEMFRLRSNMLQGDENKGMKQKAALEERWHVAMDIFSVKALVGAFEACKEDDSSYDLDSVWQLIGLSSWLVNFVERLLRACVLWGSSFPIWRAGRNPSGDVDSVDGAVPVKMEAMDVDGNLFAQEPSPESTIASPHLLHILHPFALQNLLEAVTHLNAFRAYLDTLQPSELKAVIAKSMLVDVVDCGGINFKALVIGLTKATNEVKAIDAIVLRHCFCSLTVQPSTYEVLLKSYSQVMTEDAVSKAQLFIKPADLVDGVSSLNLTAVNVGRERDIVSKGYLGVPSAIRICARCRGRTETGQTPLPRGKETSDFGRWAVWEHEWEKCICGGLWVKR